MSSRPRPNGDAILKQAPKALQPLLRLAADPSTSVDAFRAALKRQDPGMLKNNAFHVLQSIGFEDDLADLMIKFACIHESIGSDASVYAMLPSSTVAVEGARRREMSDSEACRAVRFLLDEKLLTPFPGLLYIACRAGWRQCAEMLHKEGVYRPLAWNGYSGDGPQQEATLVKLLLEVVQPTVEDLAIIKKGMKDGGVGASMIDQEIKRQGVQ